MVLENITTGLGTALTNPYSFFLLVSIVSYFLFLLIKSFNITKLFAATISILITTFLLELGLTELFSLLGAPISFGTYDIVIPFAGTYSLPMGIMLMRLLDFILDFGLVRGIGIPIIDTFVKTIPAGQITQFPADVSTWALVTSVFSSGFNFMIFMAVTVGTIIEYIFFFYFFYALLIIVGDVFKAEVAKLKPYAFILATLPILAYSYFVNSPFYIYREALPRLQKLFFFMFHADTTSLIIFYVTLALSIVLVIEIIAIFISIFSKKGIGANNIKSYKGAASPIWVSQLWDIKTQGTALMYTAIFGIMYELHQYPWFVFFPAIALYTLFKKPASGAKDVVTEHESRQNMKDYQQTVSGEKWKKESGGGMGTVVIVVLVIVTAVVGYLFLSALGLIKL